MTRVAARRRNTHPTGLLIVVLLGVAFGVTVSGVPQDVAAPDSQASPHSNSTTVPPAATQDPFEHDLTDSAATRRHTADTPAVDDDTVAVRTAKPAPGSVTPVSLAIPAIGVSTQLVDLGLNTDGTLEVPDAGFPAGWYVGAPTPGDLGPAVIVGHVDWAGQPGVFFALKQLTAGDKIVVQRSDGRLATFAVTAVSQFPKTTFPTASVYGDIDHAGLRLITCGGSFNHDTGSYRDNVVVFAVLVDS